MLEFIITCDGGSRNNQIAELREGYGSWTINAPGKRGDIVTYEFGKGVTNNEAEYMALIEALKHISGAFLHVKADLKTIKLTVRTDSQLVIGQLSKGHKINAPNLRPLVIKASNLCQQFFHVEFEKITGIEMKQILGH